MNTSLKTMVISALVLFGALASGSAMADRDGHHGHGFGHGYARGHDRDGHHGGHVRFGVSLGFPYYGPGYYSPFYGDPFYGNPYRAYAYPPVVVQPSPPPVYIEQGQAAVAPAQSYWYYCAASRSYYPYVSECPAGWQRVPVQPPAN